MKRLCAGAVAGLAGLMGAGCGFVFDLIPVSRTHVNLINRGDYNVEVELLYSDDDDVDEDVLKEFGTRLEYTVAPGGTVSFSRRCDDLRAIMIDNAKLRVVGDIGPEDDTGVLREGDDFECGDTIRFIFDHSDEITDFHITVDVQRPL